MILSFFFVNEKLTRRNKTTGGVVSNHSSRYLKSVALVVVLTAGLGALVIASQEPARDSRAGQRAPWEELEFEPVDYGRPSAHIRPMSPLNIDVVAASHPAHPDHRFLLERLQMLVRENVDPTVRVDLDHLLRRHEIIYRMEPYMATSATFSVNDGRGYISLNANKVAAMSSVGSVLVMQSVIAHEFVHYQQWKRSTDPFARSSFDDEIGRSDSRRSDPRLCSLVWKNEREAYHHICQLLNGNGLRWQEVGERTDYCSRIRSDAAFDQQFYYARMDSDPGLAGLCDDIWWDLAGGPRY
jgi:hypothetical protein